MDATNLTALLIALAALVSSGAAIATIVATRRSSKDQTEVDERINEFTIMRGTIQTLREDLEAAQHETETLQGALTQARKDAQRLEDEATTALANVAILSAHIDRHVPDDIPFPKLREVRHARRN